MLPARGSGRLASGISAMATGERRKGDRVTFERGFAAHMMGIDGTWRRDCVMEDVSETGGEDHGFGWCNGHLWNFSKPSISAYGSYHGDSADPATVRP